MASNDARGIILDSSVWVAFLHGKDSQHAKARGLLTGLPDVLYVPEYVLVEVATILKRKKKDEEAKKFVRKTLVERPETFMPSAELAYQTMQLFIRRDDGLSFTDTALLVLSRDYRIITFDRALARALRSGS